jgi:hypothetical protein
MELPQDMKNFLYSFSKEILGEEFCEGLKLVEHYDSEYHSFYISLINGNCRFDFIILADHLEDQGYYLEIGLNDSLSFFVVEISAEDRINLSNGIILEAFKKELVHFVTEKLGNARKVYLEIANKMEEVLNRVNLPSD